MNEPAPDQQPLDKSGGALCLACGICCDGGLFHRVDLTPSDHARLARHGLAEGANLPLPCRHFGGACTIYPARPNSCANYRCRVLEAVDAGEAAPDEGMALVERARALRAEVVALLPPGLSFVGLAEDVRTRALASRAPERQPALARFIAYRLFVERHFLAAESVWLLRNPTAPAPDQAG